MLPVAEKSSPVRVTILAIFFNFFDIKIALSTVSTTIVEPKLKSITSLNLESYFTISDAIPIYPSNFLALSFILLSTFLIVLIGRKVTRPREFSFKYEIIFFAVCSSFTTTFCIYPPSAISTAYSYFSSVDINDATVPYTFCMLFFFAYKSDSFTLL
ncbi:unknown [Clostridium sp. CAG:465]|nr:unknown [Clostridium sp. CAG:465]